MSIRNDLVKLYLRLTNSKTEGDNLSLEERQKGNLHPEPPPEVTEKIACEKIEIESGVKAVWLGRENSKNGVMIYLHGGSYIAGPYPDQWKYLADMCRQTQMAALLLNYRLAPQNPFPRGLDDVLAVIETLSANGQLNENWFLLGDSAGAGLAAATVYKLREASGSKISLPKKLILMSAWLDVTMSNPEIDLNDREDPMLSVNRLRESGASYAGGRMDLKNPLVSPLYGDVSVLPPTMIQIGTADVFLWDNRKFYRKCLDSGVVVKYEEYSGAFHDFMMVGFLPEAKKARRSQAEILLGK